MLERIRRLQDCDGIPKVRCRTPLEFFERLERNIKAPLTWRGELYFELHRGTYTTHARIKKANRRAEFLLRCVELLNTIALHAQRIAAYPAEEIETLWKLVLLNQFHDVLPGTSIELVGVRVRAGAKGRFPLELGETWWSRASWIVVEWSRGEWVSEWVSAFRVELSSAVLGNVERVDVSRARSYVGGRCVLVR
jgi:Alpha mannosidase middle domain